MALVCSRHQGSCEQGWLGMDTLDILKQARELISDERRWTRGELARDSEGHEVDEDSPSAACWCSVGAVWRVREGGENLCGALTALEEAMGTEHIGDFNDSHSHAEVLAAFDAAIAKLEGETA